MSIHSRTHFAVWAATVGFAVCLSCRTSPEAREAKFLKSGESLMAKKDYARAMLNFRNAASTMPKDAEAQYQLGLAALAGRDLRSAVGAFRKATELNPKHYAAQVKLAELALNST